MWHWSLQYCTRPANPTRFLERVPPSRINRHPSVKLIEALRIYGEDRTALPRRDVHLICGLTPLHLETFLGAELQQRAMSEAVAIRIGLFGDLAGNLERAITDGATSAAVVVEWSDLDARLGWRTAAGWVPEALSDIGESVGTSLRRIVAGVQALTDAGALVAVSMPTLPLPPVSFEPGYLAGRFVTRLQALVADATEQLTSLQYSRVLDRQRVDMLSPLSERADPRSDLATGFPYRNAHAALLGGLLADAMLPPAAKKGLITDLDDTLWRGILGDVGVEGIACTLDRDAQVHAIYQQCLVSLGASGVLLAVASKNDPELVAHALAHDDVVAGAELFFPLEVHWRPKSGSIDAILQSWNIGADSIVFVDDNPLELAEVQARFPAVECLLFPKDDPAAVVALVRRLRDLFGKTQIHDEDRLRLESLRAAASLRETTSDRTVDLDEFLASTKAELRFDFSAEAADARALELVNKTNQFNLNGRRLTDAEWQTHLADPDAFVLAASYADRFGKLGKIAVLAGRRSPDAVYVTTWVMSCRAFSRRIEFQCLRVLFDQFGSSQAVIDFVPTARNGPLQEFLGGLLDEPLPPAPLVISRQQIDARTPALHHTIRIFTGVIGA